MLTGNDSGTCILCNFDFFKCMYTKNEERWCNFCTFSVFSDVLVNLKFERKWRHNLKFKCTLVYISSVLFFRVIRCKNVVCLYKLFWLKYHGLIEYTGTVIDSKSLTFYEK